MKYLSVALISTLLLVSCKQATKIEAPLPKVTASKPIIKEVSEYLEFTGNTLAPQSVEFRARVSGFLTKINFTDGQFAKKGDLLFEIEPDNYAATLALREAAVEGAQASLDRSTIEYNRQQQMVKQNAPSLSDVEKWLA
ncbi:MAG: biotin/lipoyl-binding protein [Deltaproteobacteria bacterium]|nr:biotin/lipoyl-binding protein [Deltaproteobacteria bacterium]